VKDLLHAGCLTQVKPSLFMIVFIFIYYFKIMTLIGSLELELSLNRDRFDRQLSELQNNGTNIRVKAQLDGRSLERSLQQEIEFIKRWDLGKLNIKLAPNVDKFRDDIAKLNDRYSVRVGLTPDIENFNKQLQAMPLDCIKVDLCPDVDDFKKKLGKIANTQIDCIPIKLCADTTTLQNDIQKIKIDPITVQINANTEQLNEQIKQISIDPLNIDLKVNIEDFNKKLRIIEKSQIAPINISIVAESSVLPKAILDDFEQVSYRVQERWKEAIAFIKAEFASLAQDAASYGYLVQKGISEGSPGPSFYTRKNWGKTISDVKSSMSDLGSYSDKVGKDITGNLSAKPGKFSLFGDNSGISDDITKSIEKGFKNTQQKGLFQSLIGGGLGLIAGAGKLISGLGLGLISGLGGLILSPIKLIIGTISGTLHASLGALAMGLGLPLGEKIGGGITKGIENIFRNMVGSFEIVGQKFGQVLSTSVHKTLTVITSTGFKTIAPSVGLGVLEGLKALSLQNPTVMAFAGGFSMLLSKGINQALNTTQFAAAKDVIASNAKTYMDNIQKTFEIFKTAIEKQVENSLKSFSIAGEKIENPVFFDQIIEKLPATQKVLGDFYSAALSFDDSIKLIENSVRSFFGHKEVTSVQQQENYTESQKTKQTNQQAELQTRQALSEKIAVKKQLQNPKLSSNIPQDFKEQKIEELNKSAIELLNILTTLGDKAAKTIVHQVNERKQLFTSAKKEIVKITKQLDFLYQQKNALSSQSSPQINALLTQLTELEVKQKYFQEIGKPTQKIDGLINSVKQKITILKAVKRIESLESEKNEIKSKGESTEKIDELIKLTEQKTKLLIKQVYQNIPDKEIDNLINSAKKDSAVLTSKMRAVDTAIIRQKSSVEAIAKKALEFNQKYNEKLDELLTQYYGSNQQKLQLVKEQVIPTAISPENDESRRINVRQKSEQIQKQQSKIKGPGSYHQIAQEAASLSGFSLDEIGGLLPKLIEDKSMPATTLGSYDQINNAISVNSQDYARLKSGDFAQIGEELVGVILHELRHAIQFGFGEVIAGKPGFETLQERLQSKGGEFLVPKDAEEAKTVEKGVLASSRVLSDKSNIVVAGRNLPYEQDAYLFENRNKQAVYEKLKKESLLNQFQFQYGLMGSHSPIRNQVSPVQQKLAAFQDTAKSWGFDTTKFEQLNAFIQKINQSISNAVTKISTESSTLSSDEITHLMSAIKENLGTLNLVEKKIELEFNKIGPQVLQFQKDFGGRNISAEIQSASLEMEKILQISEEKFTEIREGANISSRKIAQDVLIGHIPSIADNLQEDPWMSPPIQHGERLPIIHNTNTSELWGETNIAESEKQITAGLSKITQGLVDNIENVVSIVTKHNAENQGLVQKTISTVLTTLDHAIASKVNHLLKYDQIGNDLIIDVDANIQSLRQLKGQDIKRLGAKALRGVGNAAHIVGGITGNIAGALTPGVQAGYSILKGTENAALGLLPFGREIKSGVQNIALPMAAMSAATHFLPGGAAVSGAIQTMAHGAIDPLASGMGTTIAHAITGGLTEGLSSVPIVGHTLANVIGTAITNSVTTAISGIGSIAAELGAPLLAGKALLNSAGQFTNLALPQINDNRLLPGATQLIETKVEQAVAQLGEKLTIGIERQAEKIPVLLGENNPKQLNAAKAEMRQLPPSNSTSSQKQIKQLPQNEVTIEVTPQKQIKQLPPAQPVPNEQTVSTNPERLKTINAGYQKSYAGVKQAIADQDAVKALQIIKMMRDGVVQAKQELKLMFDAGIIDKKQLNNSQMLLGKWTKQTNEQLENAARQSGIKWKLGINHILQEFAKMPDVASKVGFDIVGGLAEHSPGPSYQVRMAWGKTTNFLKEEFTKLPAIASEVGYDILGGLAEHSPGPSMDTRNAWQKTVDFMVNSFHRLPSISKKVGLEMNQNLNPEIEQEISGIKQNIRAKKVQKNNKSIQQTTNLNEEIKHAQSEMEKRILIWQQELIHQGFNVDYAEVFKQLETGQIQDMGYNIAKDAQENARQELEKIKMQMGVTRQPTKKRGVNLKNKLSKLQKDLFASKDAMDERILIWQQELMSQGFDVSYADVAKQFESGKLQDLGYNNESQKISRLRKRISKIQKIQRLRQSEYLSTKNQAIKPIKDPLEKGSPAEEFEKIIAEYDEIISEFNTLMGDYRSNEIPEKSVQKARQNQLRLLTERIRKHLTQRNLKHGDFQNLYRNLAKYDIINPDMDATPDELQETYLLLNKMEARTGIPMIDRLQTIKKKPLLAKIVNSRLGKLIGSTFNNINENRSQKALDQAKLQVEGAKTLEFDLTREIAATKAEGGDTKEFTKILHSVQKARTELEKFAHQDILTGKQIRQVQNLNNEIIESYQLLGKEPLGKKVTFLDKIFNVQGLKNIFEVVKGFVAFNLLGNLQYQLIDIAKNTFGAFIEFDKFKTVLEYSVGSGHKVGRSLQFINQTVSDMKIPLKEAMQGYGKLLGSTKGNTALEGKTTDQLFTGVSEASTVLGLTGEEQSGIILAVSQMASKGKVMAEELRGQLAERIPGAMQIAARAMGVTTQEIGKMMDNGELYADDFLPRFAKALHSQFGEAAKNASNNAQSAIFDFQNSWLKLQASIGEGLSPIVLPGVKIASEGLKLATAGAKDLGIAIAALSVGLGIKLTQALITVGSNLILQFAPGGTVTGAVTSGLQTINNSFTAKLVGGLFVALEIGKTLYDWINTDLVKSFQKAAEKARVLVDELKRINKERENKSAGKETPLSKDTPDQTIADPVIRFLRGQSWLKVFGVEKSWKTWGENQEETTRNESKNFREKQIEGLGENQKTISDIKSRKNGFENLDQINNQLKDLENRRKILNHEIEKNYRSRGLAAPYEMTKQIDDLNKQITDLTEKRSGIISPATKGLDIVEKQIEAVKSKIEELKSPEYLKSLSEEGRKEAEDEVTRNEKVLEDLKKQKSEFEKVLSKPNPLLEIFRTLQIINIELQRAQELTKKWVLNEKLNTVENQFKNIRTDYFGNENASVQNATTERDKSIKDLEALKAQSETVKKLFSTKDGEAILAEMGLDINSTLADIERANQLIGNEEGSQTKKQVLEQFKTIKQGEEQILEMRSDVAQKEIALLQAKEQRKLNIIQKSQQDAEYRLKLGINAELVQVKKLQSSKQIEEEEASLKLAQIQYQNIKKQEENLKEQLSSIEKAYQEGELTAKTYADKKREINQQLSDMSVQIADQEIAVEQAKRQKLLTELEYQRKIREHALTIKTAGATLQVKTDLYQGKISDKESSAAIAKIQHEQSQAQIQETFAKLQELEVLKRKNVYTDREYAKEKMQLQEQLLQQQNQEMDNLIQYRNAQKEAIKDAIEYKSEIRKLSAQISSNTQLKTVKEGLLSGKYTDKQVAVKEAEIGITIANIDLQKLRDDLQGLNQIKERGLITERDYKIEVLRLTQQIGQTENAQIDAQIKLREARKAEIKDFIDYTGETQTLTAQAEFNKQLRPIKEGVLSGKYTDKQFTTKEAELAVVTSQIDINKAKTELEGINILRSQNLINERDYKLEILRLTQKINQAENARIDAQIKLREARKAQSKDSIDYWAESYTLTEQIKSHAQLKPIKESILAGSSTYTDKDVAVIESRNQMDASQIDIDKAKYELEHLEIFKKRGWISDRDYKLEILRLTQKLNQAENTRFDAISKYHAASRTRTQDEIDYKIDSQKFSAQIKFNKELKPIKEGLLTGKYTDKQAAVKEANNAIVQAQIDMSKKYYELGALKTNYQSGHLAGGEREYKKELLKITSEIGQAENNIVDAKLKQRQARKEEIQEAIDYRMEMRKLAAQIELNRKLAPIKQGILTGKYTDKQAAALESNNAVAQSQLDLTKAKADLAGLNQLKKEGLISTRQYQLESRKIILQIGQAENNIVDAKLKQRQARKDEIQDAIDYRNELRQLASYSKIAPQLLSVKQGILSGKFNEKSASYQEAKIALTTGKNDLIKLQNELKGIEFMYQQKWITPRDYTLTSGRKNKEITQQKVTNVDNAIRAKQTYTDMRLGAIDLTQQEQEYTADKKISSQLTPLREKRLRGEVEQYDIDIITAKGELEKANNQLTKIIPARRKEINQLIKDRYLNSTQGREKLLQLNKEELSQEKTAFDQRKQMAETQINARKAKIDREINLEKYGNEQRNFEVQKRLKLAQLAGKSFEREIKINDIKLGMQSNLLDISNLYKQFNFVSTQSGLTKGERAEKQAEIGRQIMEKQKAYMEGQLQLQDENRTAINELVDIQLRGYQRVNEVKSNGLEIQSKEIENTLKLSDINKQLVDSQYNYSKAIQDISLQKSEGQLEKFKLGTDLFGKILGDENFTNNANFSGKMALVYAEYKSVINKQLRDKLKGIISLDEVFSAKGEKERQLGLEMRILDFRFNAENTIATQKLTALQSEQKYQQVLLQIDLQRTELQSKQAKYSAQKAELDAQNAVYSAKAELDKITNTKYQSEEAKTSAINDAKQKLDFAEQGLKIAKESGDIAKNALDSQAKLSGIAKDLQKAQQEGAIAQFNASEDARRQANELEKAQKSWDIMSQNQQKAGSNSTSTNNNPTDKNIEKLTQPSLKVWGGNLAYNPQTFLFQLQNLSGSVERLASRPSTLIVQSTNPVQDSATIYQNIGRNTVRSAGL
jgi:tape measure domain-containing protein